MTPSQEAREYPEPVAFMYPSDLAEFQRRETTAVAVSVSCTDMGTLERTVPLFTAEQMRSYVDADRKARQQEALDARRLNDAERLHAAVRTVCGQAGEAPEAFVEWLCNGGFAEMVLAYFTSPAAETARFRFRAAENDAAESPSRDIDSARDPVFGGHSYEASMLRDLLARIHGDGGHYVAQHGLDKAIEDADALVANWRASAPQASQPPQGAEPPTDWEAAYRQFADGPAFGPEVPALKKAFAAGMAWQASQSEGALRAIMRAADAAKEPCGMDPESPAAIRNGKFATIAQIAAQGLGLVRGPSLAAPPQGASSLLPGWKLVPIEPTPEMLRAAIGEGWVEPYTAPRESGVPTECDISKEDADWINAECSKEKAAEYRAMLAASPLPAPQEPARNSTLCARCDVPAVEAIVDGARTFPTCPCGSKQFIVTLYAAPAPDSTRGTP